MKSLLEVITEQHKASKLDLISKYLDAYTVIGGEKTGPSKNRRISYSVVCKSKSNIKDICTGIWSIIAEWQGRDKPEQDCIKYMTAMWESAWDSQEGTKEIRIPFDLYEDESEKANR